MAASASPGRSGMTDEPYLSLAILLVGCGLLDALLGGDRPVAAALLLLGCLCAIAALPDNRRA